MKSKAWPNSLSWSRMVLGPMPLQNLQEQSPHSGTALWQENRVAETFRHCPTQPRSLRVSTTRRVPFSVCPSTVRLLFKLSTHSKIIVVGLASKVTRSKYFRKSNQDLPEEPEASAKDLGAKLQRLMSTHTQCPERDDQLWASPGHFLFFIFRQPRCSILINCEDWSRGRCMNHASP